MKRCTSIILAIFLLFTCFFTVNPTVYASEKESTSRAIAIVFDNSGSMYNDGDMAWCRATYAMEVFASMLNDGDTLQIYPMHPITVDNKEYTMENPFIVSDASKAYMIRDIFTPKASGTPIESLDHAIEGIKEARADKKYVIVLTDGDEFYLKGAALSKGESKRQLGNRFEDLMSTGIAVMYLGIGESVIMPDIEDSELFAKKHAANSENVLSALTDMCNQIFGRDTLPKNHIQGMNIDFDISMSKLIVFVQGENVSNLKVTGTSGAVGTLQSTNSTRYGTAGCGNYNSVPDTSLQGIMVTYTDCDSGNYTIEYSGQATSVEVYYEPNADLDFVFTDAAGNNVDANALYEGDYKVSFGMKDAKTGELISSDLLGKPSYQGSYSINGTETPISCEGYSGEVPVSLNMNDTFTANLTVTYLSGYTITKDSSDFGWPNGGIKVAARPAGSLVLEITGGMDVYSLQHLEEGEPYIAKVYYQGKLLSGSELKKVDLKWDPDTSNVEIKKEFSDDHYKLTLHYKDEDHPEDTICGKCTVDIYAFYAAKGSDQASTNTPLSYYIEDDFSPLTLEIYASQDYIVIAKLEENAPIEVKLLMDGKLLSSEEYSSVELLVETNGINYELIPNEKTSSYSIKLLPTEGIDEGNYKINITALYTDNIGRVTETSDFLTVTLSNIPLWVKWVVSILLLLLLIAIILLILHIKLLPKNAHVNKKDSMMIFDGEDETKSTTFDAKMKKGQMDVTNKYAGVKSGITMAVKPGKESYLRKPNSKRSAEVTSASVKKIGNAIINEASIGSVRFILNEETGKLERVPKNEKPFMLKHGTSVSYSGTMLNGGTSKPFTVTTKLNFKKK